MTIDLALGFRQRPKGLGDTLSSLGFSLDRVVPKEDIHGVTMECYSFHDPARSGGGVTLVYHDGTYSDHHETWQQIVDDPNEIAATGALTTTMGRSRFDESKQHKVGRFLRDYYEAVLFDPQAARAITD